MLLLSLNRPAVLNALNSSLISELTTVLECVEVDPGVSAVILTGTGRAFSAGAEGFRSGYHKRGTLHHRIIPSHVHDVPVRVLTSGILACEADARPFRAGGAFFEQLELQTERVEKGFRASAISIADIDEIITQQISALRACPQK